jgi:hypothetical protein
MTYRRAVLLPLAALLALAAGCGGETSTAEIAAPAEPHPPMEYGFPVVHSSSSYKAMKYLDQSIPLYYPCDSAPKSYTFLVRGTERGRSGDCESASIKALMALQQSAAKMGANAIINLAASWDGKSMMSYSGLTYHCTSGFAGNASGIDWSGDFVIVEPEPPGKIEIKPKSDAAISIKPIEPSAGSGESPPETEGAQEE